MEKSGKFKFLIFTHNSRERREAEQRERDRQEKERMEKERLQRERDRQERDRQERERREKQLSAVEAVDHHFQLSMELAKKVRNSSFFLVKNQGFLHGLCTYDD